MEQGEGEKKQKYWGLKWANYVTCIHEYVSMNPSMKFDYNAWIKHFFQKLMKWHQQNSTIQEA